MARTLLATLCAALITTNVHGAPAAWEEVKSTHFTVIGNGGERASRHVAWQFEQIRSGLSRLWPWAKIEGPPFVIIAAKDEATLKTLAPQYWEGKQALRPAAFWVEAQGRRFVVLRTDVAEPSDASDNPYQMAYWPYAHAVFTGAFPRRIPQWYGRGIAELISNTFVREKELQVGRPMKKNLRELRERAPIPLGEFLAADRSSPWMTNSDRIRLFDAQAWAFVHYLLFGDERRHAPEVDRFNRLLHDGTDEKVAVKEAFGSDMQPLFEGMRGYVSRSLFQYARVAVSLDLKPEQFQLRTLTAGEAAAVRGELLAAMGRPLEARAFAAEATKADPTLPGPWEIEARLQDAEAHVDEARTAYAKAADLGSTQAHVYFRLAQLEWKPEADKALSERLAERLEKARQLEPANASTLSFLAEQRLDLGQADEALALAKRAVEIEPSRYYHRLALARILWSLKRADDSVRMGQSALEVADGEAQRKQVQQFLDFAARARASASP